MNQAPGRTARMPRWKRWLRRHGWSLPTPALMILGAALWLWLYERDRTAAVQLPQTDVKLVYTRVETGLGINKYRTFEVTGVIPQTRIHTNIGGANDICIAEGQDINTGRRYVRASDRWGIVWFDLDDRCVWNTTKPTQIEPPERLCAIDHSMDVPWQRLGKIIDAASGEPVFQPGEYEECNETRIGRRWY